MGPFLKLICIEYVVHAFAGLEMLYILKSDKTNMTQGRNRLYKQMSYSTDSHNAKAR